jgi:hypothetical protein
MTEIKIHIGQNCSVGVPLVIFDLRYPFLLPENGKRE